MSLGTVPSAWRFGDPRSAMASRTSLFVNSIQVVSNGNRTHGRADRIEDGFDSDTLAAMATASLSRMYTCAPDSRFLVEIRASSWRVPSGYSRPDENSFSVFTRMPPYSSRSDEHKS